MTAISDLEQLRQIYPKLSSFFEAVEGVTYPDVPDISLKNAMVRVVNSQMLSTSAATAILNRIEAKADEQHCESMTDLSKEDFRSCGMSGGKIRSIHEFRDRYTEDPDQYEAWRQLAFDELLIEVDKIWGISTWTAEMLAMFYFGHRDVFPTKDLAINKGVALVKTHLDDEFETDKASPYRTLLARCIWRSFDVGFWDGLK